MTRARHEPTQTHHTAVLVEASHNAARQSTDGSTARWPTTSPVLPTVREDKGAVEAPAEPPTASSATVLPPPARGTFREPMDRGSTTGFPGSSTSTSPVRADPARDLTPAPLAPTTPPAPGTPPVTLEPARDRGADPECECPAREGVLGTGPRRVASPNATSRDSTSEPSSVGAPLTLVPRLRPSVRPGVAAPAGGRRREEGRGASAHRSSVGAPDVPVASTRARQEVLALARWAWEAPGAAFPAMGDMTTL